MNPDHGTVFGESLDDVGSPTEFPQLSEALLRTVTAQALREVPPFFPDEPLDDCDVLDYYERICDFGKDLENIEDDPEKQLMELGLSRARLRSLKDNLDELGKLYAIEPEGLWKLYVTKTLMVWIVAGAVYTSTFSTCAQNAGDNSGGEQNPEINDSENSASNATARGDNTKPTGGQGGGQEVSRSGGTGGGRRQSGEQDRGTGKGSERLMRDTVFPKENETYYDTGKDFFQASPHHTPFSYEDVEFPKDRTAMKGTSSKLHDETAQELGATKEESEGTENEPEFMWSIKTNTLMRSVYHGLPAFLFFCFNHPVFGRLRP
ncbi:hypothetical protein FN846DRAFT_1004541 [Sphaerosporella brunnea]|uniref:Uncharacterized protein n=1 Tax=Sphaerosporella brunnea TaxID=1250544 RepID=A0A5J5EEB7_9PEZI|nr:hypothetical protein FN846DRAFT_1004541 [Sphaerosporella brunnea]